MQIIRDEETCGLFTVALMVDWGIRRCNYKACREKPNTIVAMQDGVTHVFGLCEEHYQSCNVPGGGHLELEWDRYDAWAEPATSRR